MKKLLTTWFLPVGVSLLLFLAVRPTFAQTVERQANLAQYLTANNVEVGSEMGENGFRQIYYVWDDQKHFVTDTNYPSGEPDTAGEYIVWMGQTTGAWQIFRHHIPTQTTIQLSGTENNANPQVDSRGRVVWEGWDPSTENGEGGWQVFYFDGTRVTQLTSGDLSINPDIEGDYISYGRRDVSGTWRSVVYSISEEKTADVTTGLASKRPRVTADGEIILAGTGVEETFSLTADDLFLLDLSALTATESATVEEDDAPQTVTEEEIVQELEGSVQTATDSAGIETTPTPTEAPVQ